MIETIESRDTAVLRDLVRAHDELAGARGRQRQKDSPGNREAVVACLSVMDALLDRYLLAQRVCR
jgi:hypothetical protein